MNFGLIAVQGKLDPANNGGLNFWKYTPLASVLALLQSPKIVLIVHSSVGFVDICYHMLSPARAILEIDQRMCAISPKFTLCRFFFLAIDISLYYKKSRSCLKNFIFCRPIYVQNLAKDCVKACQKEAFP